MLSTVVTAITAPEQMVTSRRKSSSNATSNITHKKTPDSTEGDFFWSYTEEPHRTRRQAIIKAHPEARQMQNWAIATYLI